MKCDWQEYLKPSKRRTAASLPPAMVEETGWDIILALYADRHCELGLRKLASLVSVPQRVMDAWLAKLAQRELIAGTTNRFTGEIHAALTPAGRSLIDRYLSAASSLQAGAQDRPARFQTGD